jgi:peptidoglycan-N-acetylglucosamine deacetylase
MRKNQRLLGCLTIVVGCVTPMPAAAQKLAITLDDGPMLQTTPLMTAEARNDAILRHLHKRHTQALFFVTLENGADRPDGLTLLKRLSDAGQLIANHTDTHPDFNAEGTTLNAFEEEILRCDEVIRTFPGYRKLFRFPFLKEGASDAKRDGIRDFLKQHEYRIGYVSIDTSDWLLDQKLTEALVEEPRLDLRPWRELYLDHLWNHAMAYERLARRVYGREVIHTLLLHHRLLNALFLGDVIDMFRSRGWRIVNPDVAFADPAYQVAPMIPVVDGSVLETTASALGIPSMPVLSDLQTTRELGERADMLRGAMRTR